MADHYLCELIAQAHPGDEEKVRRLAIIDDQNHTVRMAHLAIVGSHSVT